MILMKKINILLGVIGFIALNSCVKDDMEVQKNKDLTWDIDQDIVNDDIRTRIGYDPRFTYKYVSTKEVEVPVQMMGATLLNVDNTEKRITVELSKPLDNTIQVTLAYDADLFNKISDKYKGYQLGEQSLVSISEATKTIEAGQTKAEFSITTNIDGAQKLVFPFSVIVEGDNSIKSFGLQGQDFFVVRTELGNAMKQSLFLVDKDTELSESFRDAINRANQNITRRFAAWRLSIHRIDIGQILDDSFSGTGILYEISNGGTTFPSVTAFDVIEEGDNIRLKSFSGGGGYYIYFGEALAPIDDLIKNSAPYRVEVMDGGADKIKVKLISTTDENVWFVLSKFK